MREKFLQSMLAGESKAYGFTIAFWGTGAVLASNFGLPDMLQALSYGLGAVTGFGLLTLLVFGGADSKVKKTESKYMALATIHYLASLGPILVAGAVARFLPAYPAFFIGGLSISLTYNLLTLLEENISEFITGLF